MKKIIKIIGNVVMIAALAFVVKKLFDMDISISQFRDGRVLTALFLCMIVTTVIIIFSCYPWLVFTRSLSGRKIPFSTAMPVYTQSNLYKYIPGNVFQYVGRNQLASDMDISHVDVACATVLDILFCVFWTGVISVVLLRHMLAEVFSQFMGSLVVDAIIGIIIVAIIILLLRLKFKDKFKAYISRYAKAFAKENRAMLLRGAFYYLLQNLVSACMYFVCLKLIIPQADTAELITLTGAFMAAWIIGFVTPGAPGGIGIREGVMLFVCGDKFSDRIVLFVLVMRIASIGADIAAFIIGKIYAKAKPLAFSR